MNRNRVLILLSVVLIAGCASVPTEDIKLSADADPKAKFSGYQTYGWMGMAAVLNDPYGRWNPPALGADAGIKQLIDRELRKRGLVEADVAPDLNVLFAVGIDMDALELKIDPKSAIRTVENVPSGGLVIALVDHESGFVIWMGVATADIHTDLDAKTAKARLDNVVTRLLRKVPW